ncbi:MAG: thioredoxin [Lactobacillaceae bacterium]|jgi:thioredoxin 1|nr:thioredoxin [Lactobacillaceae bacterium]
MKSIKDNEFQKEVLSKKGLVLVDFWAEWCGPCRQLGPILEEIAKENSDIEVIKMNVDETPGKAAEFGIRSIPTMLLFKNGELVDTKIGFSSKDSITSWITSKK